MSSVSTEDRDESDDSGSQDVELTGGNWSAVVRRGEAVHRSAGSWTCRCTACAPSPNDCSRGCPVAGPVIVTSQGAYCHLEQAL